MKALFILIAFIYGLTILLQTSTIIENFLPKLISMQTKSVNKSIFCIIIASSNDIETRAKAVGSTWAKKCDNYKIIVEIEQVYKIDKNKLNKSYFHEDEIIYNNMSLMEPFGMSGDTYNKLTDKMYRTIIHLYKKYNDYDWYLKADVDTFIFVENLRKFLSNKNKSWPVTYGCDFAPLVDRGFHSGGAGYVLSNEALIRLGSKLNESYTFCPNSGSEDVDVAKCLRLLGVYPNKSIDELGRERFHPFDILVHYEGINGKLPDWIHTYAINEAKLGVNCCSDESISFHYMKDKNILLLHDIIDKKNFKKFQDLVLEYKSELNKTLKRT